jgi:ABC-2 type transport system ATP-binding protein
METSKRAGLQAREAQIKRRKGAFMQKTPCSIHVEHLRKVYGSVEEAERLCDRVAIVDHGRVIALDSPENLIRGLGVENRVVFTIDGTPHVEPLRRLPSVSSLDLIGDRVIVAGKGDALLTDVVNALSSNGFQYHDVHTEQPTLEDVFLKLTGRAIHD